jgi:uncharacterized protein (DUF2336 family)
MAMAITRAALTEVDVRTLVRGVSDDERAAAAHKLCRRMDMDLTDQERAAAQDVLRMMALDAAELVRRAMAVTLRGSKIIPRDVALKLAEDVDSIALPILTNSPSLTDEDLCEIVRAAPAAKQIAVARRPMLTAQVASAVAKHGCEAAVRVACSNDNADFNEDALITVVERFADSESVATAIAYRKVVPLAISEKLAELVSAHVRRHLVEAHGLPSEIADELAMSAHERATVDLVDQAGRASDMKAFVAHLHRQEKLTPSLLLRALAHGHMSFFEWAVAELAQVPHHRAWLMVHDAGALGLRAIFERAALPAKLFPAFRTGVDTYHALQLEGDLRDVTQFQERMLQRYLTQPLAASRADIDYLLERLDSLSQRATLGRSAA